MSVGWPAHADGDSEPPEDNDDTAYWHNRTLASGSSPAELQDINLKLAKELDDAIKRVIELTDKNQQLEAELARYRGRR